MCPQRDAAGAFGSAPTAAVRKSDLPASRQERKRKVRAPPAITWAAGRSALSFVMRRLATTRSSFHLYLQLLFYNFSRQGRTTRCMPNGNRSRPAWIPKQTTAASESQMAHNVQGYTKFARRSRSKFAWASLRVQHKIHQNVALLRNSERRPRRSQADAACSLCYLLTVRNNLNNATLML